jgi:hypothetical protein
MSSDDVEYTQAELRQRELDQQNPQFLAWLSRMDDELALFFERDVPDMPADPFTEEGLRRAEAAAIRLFWHRTPEDGPFAYRKERFERFIGEVFVRKVEGKWMWINVSVHGHAPVVSRPATPLYLEPDGQLSQSLTEKCTDGWTFVFRNSVESYEAWKAAGRLPPKDWFDYQHNERWGYKQPSA